MTDLFSPVTELFYDSRWNDISTDVFTRDDITLSYGQADEASELSPGKCRLTINNASGKYSPRNPYSPLYGKIGRNTPLRISLPGTVDSAPSYDAGSFFTGTATGNFSWTHTPVRDPQGVIVFVGQSTTGADQVTGVTYGGVSMTEVPGSPLLLTSGVEDGAVYGYFLGSGIPTGPQTVEVTVSGGAVKDAHAITFTADANTTELEDTSTLESAGIDDPSVTLTTTVQTFIAAYLLSGQDDATGWSLGPGFTWGPAGQDFGTMVGFSFRSSSAAAAGSPVAGVTTPGVEEAALLAVAVKNGPNAIRFTGEVPAWAPSWDLSGNDVWVPLEATGITRRLSQGSSALKSAIFREYTKPTRSVPVAYWPGEDGSSSTLIASGLDGGTAISPEGAVEFAEYEGFPGSEPVIKLATGRIVARIPGHTKTGDEQVRAVVKMPATITGTPQVIGIRTTGTASLVELLVNTSGNPLGNLQLQVYDPDGTLVFTGTNWAFNVLGRQIELKVRLTQVGADVVYYIGVRFLDTNTFPGFVASQTIAGRTQGNAVRVSFGYNYDLPEMRIGHITFSNDDAFYDDTLDALVAWQGETAGRRYERLCAEEGIVFESIGDLDSTVEMGAQRPKELLDLFTECAASDGGIQYETRAFVGLGYRTRESLMNQSARLALSYSAGHIGEPFEPTEDDQRIRNDVTVKREGGSSSRSVLQSGPLSIAAPPDGVGRYDQSETLSLFLDEQTASQASWRRHLGTWDEARYPAVKVQLTTNASLRNGAVSLRAGDVFTVSALPAWLPPDIVENLMVGYTEEISVSTWTITYNAIPARPFTVFVVASQTYGRLDTNGSTLATGITSGDTSLSIATVAGSAPWITTASRAGDFPFDIVIGGEVMRVTAIVNAASPQTFTVARSINGVVKAHSAGAVVKLARPAMLSI